MGHVKPKYGIPTAAKGLGPRDQVAPALPLGYRGRWRRSRKGITLARTPVDAAMSYTRTLVIMDDRAITTARRLVS